MRRTWTRPFYLNALGMPSVDQLYHVAALRFVEVSGAGHSEWRISDLKAPSTLTRPRASGVTDGLKCLGWRAQPSEEDKRHVELQYVLLGGEVFWAR